VSCRVGNLAASASAHRSFVVEVVELPGAGHEIPNTARVSGDQPDPDCGTPTPAALCNEDDEKTPQPEIDLGITKTDGDAVVRRVGDEFTYRLEVTNDGPDDATGVTVTDELDPMIGFVSSEHCVAKGPAVSCDIGDLPAKESVVVGLRVRVVSLPAPGSAIPNVATVQALEPDPDCTDATPAALCNDDDEQTPRPRSPRPPTDVATPGPSGPLPRTGTAAVGLVATGTAAILLGMAVLAARRRATR